MLSDRRLYSIAYIVFVERVLPSPSVCTCCVHDVVMAASMYGQAQGVVRPLGITKGCRVLGMTVGYSLPCASLFSFLGSTLQRPTMLCLLFVCLFVYLLITLNFISKVQKLSQTPASIILLRSESCTVDKDTKCVFAVGKEVEQSLLAVGCVLCLNGRT